MKVGFTGTRRGLSDDQAAALHELLQHLSADEWHHGDAVGADADFHAMVEGRGIPVIGHPSDIPHQRAYCRVDQCRNPLPPLDCSTAIVMVTDLIVGCPGGMYEEDRSWTWSTIRKARRVRKPILLVWPDGSVTSENCD